MGFITLLKKGKHVKRFILLSVCFVFMAAFVSGCATRNAKVSKLKLGMVPDEVVDAIGKPSAIRASKIYEGNEWTEVWEYPSPVFTWAPKTYWIYFENGKVVQWGEPGDFLGGGNANVSEYSNQKRIR